MATTVTTFQREKTGNLVFPIYTEYGIINNPELIPYIEDMVSLGHEWTSSDVYAFDQFITTGKADGWWNKMMTIFPLWGTSPECLFAPLIQKIGPVKHATMAGTSTYDVPNPDWEAVASYQGGKVVGFSPLINRTMASPFSVSDVLVAMGISDGVVRGGYTIIAKPSPTTNHPRYWGISETNIDVNGKLTRYQLGIQNVENNPSTRAGIGRALSNRAIGSIPPLNYFIKVKLYENTGQAGIIYGDLNNVTIDRADLSANPASPINLGVAQKLKFCIGGITNTDDNGDFTGSLDTSIASVTRWHSVDMGDLSDYQELSYQDAIRVLFTAIGK